MVLVFLQLDVKQRNCNNYFEGSGEVKVMLN